MKKISIKPRKMNSKFHSHVPEMKINQLRVELDNMESDFDNEQFVWKFLYERFVWKSFYNSFSLENHL